MAVRDPVTGQFRSAVQENYDDIEVASWLTHLGVQAADLTGTTGFGGQTDEWENHQVVDLDDILDRDEAADLIAAYHRVVVFQNSTATADGTVQAHVEVATSGNRLLGPAMGNTDAVGGAGDVVGTTTSQDTIDLIGRALTATGHAPFSDGATGVGGGGSAGEDQVALSFPPGRLGQFHPRDEVVLNGRFAAWNIDDAAIHVMVSGQHWYGVKAQ